MARKLLFIASIVLLFAASAQAVGPTVVLPSSSYPGLRMMQGSTAPAINSSVKVTAKSTTAAGMFTLTSDGVDALTLSIPGGTVPIKSTKAVPFTFKWTSTSTTGAQLGRITLAQDNSMGTPVVLGSPSQMTVDGAIIANRVLTVNSLGTGALIADAVRIMKGVDISSTKSDGTGDPLQLSSGSGTANDDNHATRVNVLASKKASDPLTKIQVRYKDATPLAQFNGADQDANLTATFKAVGHMFGTLDLATKMLADGETEGKSKSPVVGATLQSAELEYNANVLEQRKLKTTSVAFKNSLAGINVAEQTLGYKLATTNKSINYGSLTNVRVAGTTLGPITVDTTDVTTTTGSDTYMSVHGTLDYYLGNAKASAELGVTSLEDALVGDTKAYKNLKISYSASNVGYAKIKKEADFTVTDKDVLSGKVAAGSTAAGFKSRVLKGKLDWEATAAATVTQPVYKGTIPAATGIKTKSNLKNLYGSVGSEALIAASTPIAAGTTVTMEWRARTKAESYSLFPGPDSSKLPPGNKYLTSDVVAIGGFTSSDYYALQMSFDDRILLALEGQTNGTIENQAKSLFIAQNAAANGSGIWEKLPLIGTKATGFQGVETLATFLAGHPTDTLDELAGSWGVDPTAAAGANSASAAGVVGHSWAIVRGGGTGIFAVVPEPSTLALLFTAGIGLMAYGFRRWRRK